MPQAPCGQADGPVSWHGREVVATGRLAEGEAGLSDRSSRPRRCPRRTDAKLEERVCRLAAQHPARAWCFWGRAHGLPADVRRCSARGVGESGDSRSSSCRR